MQIKSKKDLLLRNVVTIFVMMVSMLTFGQSNGDKLFMEGQRLQQKQTVASQTQAIKKFEAAKVVYTSADKKKMCDNQITICNNNIASLKRVSSGGGKGKKVPAPQEVKLSLSQNRVLFDGDKNGMSNVAVTAPTIEWTFTSPEGIEGEENYVRATRSSDAKSINLEVEANNSTLKRHQSFVVSYGSQTDTLVVSQSGKEVTLSTNTNLVEFKLKGGSKSIELYTNSDSTIKKKSVVGKGLSALRGLVSGTAKAATAADVKTSTVKIVTLGLPKNSPQYSTGRRGEIIFASQDKTYKITVIQQ